MIGLIVSVVVSLVLLILGYLVGLLGSIHGPAHYGEAVLALVAVGLIILWASYGYIRWRRYRRSGWLMAIVGVLVIAGFLGASNASYGLLVERESAEQERLAAATQVFNVHDEPLLSAQGDPIGIRLRYSMRFPTSDYFWHTPSLRAGKDFGAGLWADGRFTEPTVTPVMQPGKYGAPRYEAGKQYDFAVDVLPYFLVQNKAKTKLCIVEPPAEYRAGWERLMESGEALHYKITIQGTKFEGETANAYSPKTFYENALKEGAVRLTGLGLGGSVSPCP